MAEKSICIHIVYIKISFNFYKIIFSLKFNYIIANLYLSTHSEVYEINILNTKLINFIS